MGCVSSSEEDKQPKPRLLSLQERKQKAKKNRREAKSLVHNLVHEEFGRDISESYNIEEDVLGVGLQGVVRIISSKTTGVKYAMKTVPLGAGKDSKAMTQLRSEVDLIRRLDHPNIVRLQEVFETEESMFLVMDLCTGGDMMSRWERNRRLKYSENDAANTVKKIVNAVRYCHQNRVVHRDIKLENILWEHPGPDAEPQLVDFGLGVTFSNDEEVFREDVGSLYYVAPEVLGRNYTKACDCWSIGVITYMLLAGMPPFLAPTDEGVKLKIKWAKVGFPKHSWGMISGEAKDFIKRLLVKAPNRRMTTEEACAHPWLTMRRRPSQGLGALDAPAEAMAVMQQPTGWVDGNPDEDPANEALDPSLVRRLMKYGGYGALKRTAFGVIAHSLSPEEIRKLRTEFQKVDVEGRGELRPGDLEKALKTSGNFSSEEVTRMFHNLDVDHDGKIGFTEFLAAALTEGHVNNETLRLAFDRMDYENSGKVTLENLAEFTGATVEEEDLRQQITDQDLRDALLGTEGGGVTYDMFRKVMVKNFSVRNFDDENITKLVRVASKLSIDELAAAMEGTKEEAATVIEASNAVRSSLDKNAAVAAGGSGDAADDIANDERDQRRSSLCSMDSGSGMIVI